MKENEKSNLFDKAIHAGVWITTVSIEYRDQIVCAECFEVFASEKQIELLRRKG